MGICKFSTLLSYSEIQMYHKTHFNRGQEKPTGLPEYLDLAS